MPIRINLKQFLKMAKWGRNKFFIEIRDNADLIHIAHKEDTRNGGYKFWEHEAVEFLNSYRLADKK